MQALIIIVGLPALILLVYRAWDRESREVVQAAEKAGALNHVGHSQALGFIGAVLGWFVLILFAQHQADQAANRAMDRGHQKGYW